MVRPGPRTAITAIFFLNGAAFSAWYARLPAIADRLDLGDAQVGLALLGAPLGLLVAQPVAGAVVARRGSRAVVALAPLLLPAVVLPALAVDLPTLVLAVIAVGAANGTLDIAMNAQGLVVERAVGRPLFGSLHAAFSFGALAGAAAAAAIAGAGVEPVAHLLAWGAAAALVALAIRGALIGDRDAADPAARRLPRPSARLAAFGLIAFCALLAEGAVFDWSGLLLHREAGASQAVAALGLAAFSLAMGTGRLVTDRAAAALGPPAAARAGALLAASGLALTLAAARPAPGIAGFAVMGLGLAAVFPLTLRAAGGAGVQAGPDLAAVSTVGYGGFLLGPPVIGLLAEATSLRAALGLVCAACLVAAASAGALRAAPVAA